MYKIKFLDGSVKEFENLIGANLSGANLRGASLSGANLHRVRISPEPDFKGVIPPQNTEISVRLRARPGYVTVVKLSEVLNPSSSIEIKSTASCDCGAKYVGMPHSDWCSTQK